MPVGVPGTVASKKDFWQGLLDNLLYPHNGEWRAHCATPRWPPPARELRNRVEAAARGPGTPYLHLGFWIEGCRKVNHKTRFRSLEAWNERY